MLEHCFVGLSARVDSNSNLNSNKFSLVSIRNRKRKRKGERNRKEPSPAWFQTQPTHPSPFGPFDFFPRPAQSSSPSLPARPTLAPALFPPPARPSKYVRRSPARQLSPRDGLLPQAHPAPTPAPTDPTCQPPYLSRGPHRRLLPGPHVSLSARARCALPLTALAHQSARPRLSRCAPGPACRPLLPPPASAAHAPASARESRRTSHPGRGRRNLRHLSF